MSRKIASIILGYLPDGSFMIRQSVLNGRVDKLALSLKLVSTYFNLYFVSIHQLRLL